jgi:hypothetical protein
MRQRYIRMLDRLRHNSPDRRLAVVRLMAMAFVIFVFLSFNSAHAKPANSAHVKHTRLTHVKHANSEHVKYKNSAHVKHTKNASNLIKNGNNLIKNGDNLIYDSDLDITWYYNPSLGAVNWNDAMEWATNLEIGIATDWQLPAASVTGSQLEHLYSVELGNTGNGLTNSGPFNNLQAVNYWTNTLTTVYYTTPYAFVYSFISGYQGFMDITANSEYFSAIAVHSGNVGVTQIPEPGILLLLGPGLAGVAVMRKKIIQSLNRNEKQI